MNVTDVQGWMSAIKAILLKWWRCRLLCIPPFQTLKSTRYISSSIEFGSSGAITTYFSQIRLKFFVASPNVDYVLVVYLCKNNIINCASNGFTEKSIRRAWFVSMTINLNYIFQENIALIYYKKWPAHTKISDQTYSQALRIEKKKKIYLSISINIKRRGFCLPPTKIAEVRHWFWYSICNGPSLVGWHSINLKWIRMALSSVNGIQCSLLRQFNLVF